MSAAARTTLTLEAKAYRIARQRAQARSISLGKAVSELIEEAEVHAPKTRLMMADGLPVFVPPPGTPPIDPALIRQAIEEDW
jgi:hypothetical protein